MAIWWNFLHQLHWKLSFWLVSLQPAKRILPKWQLGLEGQIKGVYRGLKMWSKLLLSLSHDAVIIIVLCKNHVIFRVICTTCTYNGFRGLHAIPSAGNFHQFTIIFTQCNLNRRFLDRKYVFTFAGPKYKLVAIRVASHKRHCASNNQKFERLLNSVWRPGNKSSPH